MFIKKIELENFTCYYGKNVFEFKDGINIIIGDNGFGKSQLFDAFYWVIYDKIFMSKEIKHFNEVKSAIISDKAKYEVENGVIKTSVKITFSDERSNNMFILERFYKVEKKDGKIKESSSSELIIMKKDLHLLQSKLVMDENEKKSIVSRILPPNKSEYLWFQGEQVDKIIDFQQQETLKKAIDVLSNIHIYDSIKQIASSLAQSAISEYEKECRRHTRDKDKSEELEKKKEELIKKIENLGYEENQLKNLLAEADERYEKLLGQMYDAQEIQKLESEKKMLKVALQELVDSLNEENSKYHRKMFTHKWVLKGTESVFDGFSEIFNSYNTKKSEQARILKLEKKSEEEALKVFQTRLPLDVPEPIYVQRMLDQERCLVCDREAKKGSEAWNKIMELIKIPPKGNGNKEVLKKNDFEKEYRALYNNGLVLSRGINDIDNDIADSIKTISDLQIRIKKKHKDIYQLESNLESFITNSKLNPEEAKDIVNEIHKMNQIQKDKGERLNYITQQKSSYEANLKSVKEELDSLVTGEIPQWLVNKKNILSDFETISKSTRDRVFKDLVSRLESEANQHYYEMTKTNTSVRGQIKLVQQRNGNYMPAITDSSGIPLHGLNTSNLILVKLAVIMAIISTNYQDYGGSMQDGIDLYTFITDAPTSVFGDAYTIGFCQTVSKVYKQSIIMSKEFYRNEKLLNELLNHQDIRLGKVYKITPSVKEEERIDRTNLSTYINEVN